MGTLALIGLGSNLGDRKAILDGAVAAMAEAPGVEVRAVSSYHETAPVGGPTAQPVFLNAAVALDAACEPLELLGRLQEIEGGAGRVRDVHWAARTLDLDILLFGDRIIGRHPRISQCDRRPQLRVPHPWLAFRRFVLAPAVEVAPQAVDPVTRWTMAELLANLDRRPSYLALAGHQGPRMRRLFRRFAKALDAAGFSNGDPSWDEASSREFAAALSRLSPEMRATDPPDHIWNDHRATALRFLGDALREDRWSEALWGDRWVVTDFWLDQWWWQNPTPSLDLQAIQERVIQPTFVAVIPPWDRDLSVLFNYLPQSPGGLLPALDLLPPLFTCRPPVGRYDLENPAARDEEFIAPILAACAATRAGLTGP